MDKLQSLIDKAVEVCGSREKVAEELGISRQQLHNIYTGKTPMADEHAGKLAMLTGVNIERALLAALMDRLSRSANGRAVLEALEKGFLAFAVAICGFFATGNDAHGTPIGDRSSQTAIDLVHIVSSWLRRSRGWLRQQRLMAAWLPGGRQSVFRTWMRPASVLEPGPRSVMARA